MSLTAQKVDAIARVLLSETQTDFDLARDELRRLMEVPNPVLEQAVEKSIHELLAKIGVPENTVGHNYLVDAIYIVSQNPGAISRVSGEDGLLAKVGEKYNRSYLAVDRAMRVAIAHAWNYGNHDFQAKHFPVVSPHTYIPTLTSFISRSANIVRLGIEQE